MTSKDTPSRKWSDSEMKNIMESIELLADIRTILRKYTPEFVVDNKEDSKTIQKALKRIAKNLIPLFEEYDLILPYLSDKTYQSISDLSSFSSSITTSKEKTGQQTVSTITSAIELEEAIGDNYVLISSNKIKKKLKQIGIEPIKILVAGGPISVEDMKTLNPSIPEKALQGIEKKIKKLYDTVFRLLKEGEKIFFVSSETENDETEKLIESRLKEWEKNIGKTIEKLKIRSWDTL